VIPYPIAFVDEPHRHPDLRLYRLWKGKCGKRGAQIAAISTAGEPGSEFEEQRETIRNKALEREYTGCHLRAEGQNLVYHEWMVPDANKARDLDVVKDANPLKTITKKYLAEKLASETLDFGEDWLRMTCNIPARSAQAAIPEADWDALQVDDGIPVGEPIWLGVDFGWQYDTTALVPLWIREPSYRLFGDPEILTPPRDGTMMDVELVKHAFERIHERNPISVVVMDPSKGGLEIARWLEDDLGIATVVARSQKPEMAIMDYDRWMEAMREGWLHHTGQREFRRHVLNAIARRQPDDRYRFDRPSTSRNTKGGRQERRVIDALTAAAMVHSTAVAELDTTEPLGAFAWA
jgi:phage terminase large subunit-like protein